MNFSYSSKDINKKEAPNSICECFESKNNDGTIETGDTKYRLSQMLFDKMPQECRRVFAYILKSCFFIFFYQ